MTTKLHQAVIHIEGLSIGYASRQGIKVVANGLSADVYGGELTCLLGTNGVGKSTLIRTLSAFLPKLSGSIVIQNREIDRYTHKQLAHVLSVVLTERLEVRNLLVAEVVGLGRSPYTDFWGKLSIEDKKVVEHAIDLVGISVLADRMVDTLSDGERQKVMIAKALAQETPVICLDEPTAFLDFSSKVETMRLLHRLSRQTGKTIFLSTHDLELALQIADRIWLMDREKGITIGTPEDLALEGSLANFLTGQGITFDREMGLFRVDNDCTMQVRLEGEGSRYAMVRKALLRNGIRADRQVMSDVRIEVDEKKSDSFTLYLPTGEVFDLPTIDALLDCLIPVVSNIDCSC